MFMQNDANKHDGIGLRKPKMLSICLYNEI